MDLVAHIAEIFGPGQSTDLVNDLLATFMPIIMPCYLYSDPDEAAWHVQRNACKHSARLLHGHATLCIGNLFTCPSDFEDYARCILVKAEALTGGIEFDLPPVDNARGALELLSSLVGGLGVEVLEVLQLCNQTQKTTCEDGCW